MEIHTRWKLCHFGLYILKVNIHAFYQNILSQSTRNIFIRVAKISTVEMQILLTRLVCLPACIHIKICKKDIVMTWDEISVIAPAWSSGLTWRGHNSLKLCYFYTNSWNKFVHMHYNQPWLYSKFLTNLLRSEKLLNQSCI